MARLEIDASPKLAVLDQRSAYLIILVHRDTESIIVKYRSKEINVTFLIVGRCL